LNPTEKVASPVETFSIGEPEIGGYCSACIFTKDQHGQYTFANARTEEFFDRPLKDIIGHDDSSFFAPDKARELQEIDRRVMDHGLTVETQEHVYLKAAGQTRVFATSKHPLRDPAGAIVGLVGVALDITEQKRAFDDLQLYRWALDQIQDYVTIVDLEGTVIYVNQAELNGPRKISLQIIGRNVSTYSFRPQDGSDFDEIIRKTRVEGSWQGLLEETQPDGQPVVLDVRTGLVRDATAKPIAIIATATDITEKRIHLDKLQLAAGVFFHAQEGILITSADGTIVDVNESCERITGYSREELLGQNPRILNSGRQDRSFYSTMWQELTSKGHWTGEIWNRRKSGEIYAVLQTINAVRNAEGVIEHYVALSSDITSSKNHQREIEHVIHYDVLTKLPNRVLLSDRIRQKMSHARRSDETVAVLCIDLDDFKSINDEFGLQAGDQILIQASDRMLMSVRSDDTVARSGGDEFVLLLGNIPSRTACDQKIRRLLEELALPYLLDNGKIAHTSASIGFTLFPEDDADPDTLLRHADQAMFLAKQSGKNRSHRFDIRVDNRHKANWSALAKIERGLERGEFRLFVQPKVSLRNGAEVVGAEALIRWMHPLRGLTPPGQFLPLLEGQVLMQTLGKWVLREAFQILQNWNELGIDIPLSVNVDAVQLRDAEFSTQLAQLLSEFPSVPANRVEIEIVESAALDDVQKVSVLIDECHALGVRFSLDDFGTGYSSLTYLKRLNVDTLKIDQSFVRDMLGDDSALAIVRGVIGLADAFHKHTVAEGVETWEHAAKLKSLNCQIIQGYAIARPMPAEQFPAWIKQFSMPHLR